jgi:hypothetical protein
MGLIIRPVSCLKILSNQGGYKAMETDDLLADYLIDPNDALKQLLTWFLNLVMQLEANQQAGANPYERSDQRKLIGMGRDNAL